jgi:hypothetical protein
MDSLKKPEMLVALASLVGVGGSYFYFSKKLGIINDRMNEFDKHLSAVIKKLTESSKTSTVVQENIKELSSSIDRLSNSIRTLENNILDDNDLINERFQVIFSALETLNVDVNDPLDDLYKPRKSKQKRRNEPEYSRRRDREDDRDTRRDRDERRDERRSDRDERRDERRSDRDERRSDRDERRDERKTNKQKPISKSKVVESDGESDDAEFIQKINANSS